jgi:hypothetical protein
MSALMRLAAEDTETDGIFSPRCAPLKPQSALREPQIAIRSCPWWRQPSAPSINTCLVAETRAAVDEEVSACGAISMVFRSAGWFGGKERNVLETMSSGTPSAGPAGFPLRSRVSQPNPGTSPRSS